MDELLIRKENIRKEIKSIMYDLESSRRQNDIDKVKECEEQLSTLKDDLRKCLMEITFAEMAQNQNTLERGKTR